MFVVLILISLDRYFLVLCINFAQYFKTIFQKIKRDIYSVRSHSDLWCYKSFPGFENRGKVCLNYFWGHIDMPLYAVTLLHCPCVLTCELMQLGILKEISWRSAELCPLSKANSIFRLVTSVTTKV